MKRGKGISIYVERERERDGVEGGVR